MRKLSEECFECQCIINDMLDGNGENNDNLSQLLNEIYKLIRNNRKKIILETMNFLTAYVTMSKMDRW